MDHNATENALDTQLKHWTQLVVQLEAVHQGTLDDLLREEAEDLQERRSDPYQREQLDLASTDEQHWKKGARRAKRW